MGKDGHRVRTSLRARSTHRVLRKPLPLLTVDRGAGYSILNGHCPYGNLVKTRGSSRCFFVYNSNLMRKSPSASPRRFLIVSCIRRALGNARAFRNKSTCSICFSKTIRNNSNIGWSPGFGLGHPVKRKCLEVCPGSFGGLICGC